MRYIKSPSTDAKFNLALEQYVFDRMDRSQSYFMLWQNDHAVIIGKHQNTIGEINEPYVREHHIDVVRRLSGGGAVYHDLGNLNFTFIVSEGDGLQSFDFSVFCRPIVQALAHFGVEAQINGRNDMTIAGKKFSGNSQYAKQGRIMHHGTILYDSDLDMVSKALQVSQDKIVSKGVQSVRSRVTNVREYMKEDIPVEAFWEKLEQYMAAETGMQAYTLTEEDIARIRVIQQQRYDTWEWNYGASPQYRIRKERRFEGCGKVEAYMEVEKGILHQLDFYGDYFGNGEKQQLIDALIGSKMEESALQKRLEDIDVGEYVCHLTQKDLIALLLQ
ncbi:MAG TPA: lipoate--protein ligase [Candidatus Anaerotignum merdipullorum]|nr:lipoate--protein ligase [Candidatus Anaerotignum merdipullorum]